jgi:hypothetical protein
MCEKCHGTGWVDGVGFGHPVDKLHCPNGCPPWVPPAQPQHPTVIQEMVPTWITVSKESEWSEARDAVKKLSEESPDKIFRIYCAPHTYSGIDHWGKPYSAYYKGGWQEYKDGSRYDKKEET